MSDSDSIIRYEQQDGIAVLTMDDGKANAIDFDWIEACNAALDRAEADGAAAVLFRGREKFFSAGLNLKVLPTYSQEEMQQFVVAYREVKSRIFLLERPVVADVGGHALAGGAVLLLGCDLCVTDPEPKKIGLNETQIGIALPPWVAAMGRARLNPAYWTQAMIAGDIFDPQGALAVGFVQEVTEDAETRQQRAMTEAKRLAALPRNPYRDVKRLLRKPYLDRADQAAGNDVDPDTIGAFFGE